MQRFLVIGANGFLGSYLLNFRNNPKIQENNIVLLASDLENSHLSQQIPFYQIDITQTENTIRTIGEINPDVVILTASMTDVDQCEMDKKLAAKINIDGPKNVITACEQTDSKLVFLSTDFIFDGTKEDGMYKETDAPNPLSYYGKTKYEAELLIKNSELEYLICRTAVLYGWNLWKLNFITWIINQLKDKKNLSIVTDQFNSPTYVENLAEIILKLLEKDAEGIFHTAGDCSLSRYEMALRTAEIFNFDLALIQPFSNLKQKAIRPKNASLDISKLNSLISSELKVLNLVQGLQKMNQIKAKYLS